MLAPAALGPAPALSLEKPPKEQFKRLAAQTETQSCVRGTWFRNTRTGSLRPFRCGTCADCLAEWSSSTRRGIYRAVRRNALTAMLTLTLPSDYHRPETPQEVVRARRDIQQAFNRFRTFLKKRGFVGHYVAVPEAHADGTAHVHVAFNDVPIVVAFGGTYRDVQSFLQDAWTRAGGGFLWWKRAVGSRPWAAAAELAKYIGKAIGPPEKTGPAWAVLLWCTVEVGFRKRPWHRYWADRVSGTIIRETRPARDPAGEWELVAEVRVQLRPRTWRCVRCRHLLETPAIESPTTCAIDVGGCGRTLEGRVARRDKRHGIVYDPDGDEIVDWTVFVPGDWTPGRLSYFLDASHADERDSMLDRGRRFTTWSPGRSVAIVDGCEDHRFRDDGPAEDQRAPRRRTRIHVGPHPELACDGHLPDPSLPFSCHHDRLDWELGCWCIPPWSFEPPWSPPELAERLDRSEPAVEAYAVVDPFEPPVFDVQAVLVPDEGYVMRRSFVRAGLRQFTDSSMKTPGRAGHFPGSRDLQEADRGPPAVCLDVLEVPAGEVGEALEVPFGTLVCTCKFCLVSGAGCRTCPRCRSRR